MRVGCLVQNSLSTLSQTIFGLQTSRVDANPSYPGAHPPPVYSPGLSIAAGGRLKVRRPALKPMIGETTSAGPAKLEPPPHPAATRPGSKLNRDNPRRNAVGTVKVTIGVGDPQGRQFEELDVTVDTGSTYTAVPRAMLQRLGIPVERSLPSETADGRIVPVDVGEATIRLQGLQFHTPVIFAEENEPSLLGAVSLGQAALAVDPLAGRLIPTNLLRL